MITSALSLPHKGSRGGLLMVPCSPKALWLPNTSTGLQQRSGWPFPPFTSALSFQADLCDSPFFAINCNVLLEAPNTNDKDSH